MSLYQLHQPSLATLYQEVERFAGSRNEVFVGTPGTLTQRKKPGGDFMFHTRQYYDGEGKKCEEYIGPVGQADAEAKVAELQGRIEAAKQWAGSIRLLVREGFSAVDRKAGATVAALSNAGLFTAGAVLVGSHAYGVLRNALAIRAASYVTEDVDIAKRADQTLAVAAEVDLLKLLRDTTGIHFVEVPELDKKKPSTSYKEAGTSRFHIDLLVPSEDESFPIVRVPELNAHATGLPYLAYLLGQTQTNALLTRDAAIAVRIPTPERFALHKLIVSQLRGGNAKSQKDLEQASVLLAALSERYPGAIEDAVNALPVSARNYVVRAARALEGALQNHPMAMAELSAGA